MGKDICEYNNKKLSHSKSSINSCYDYFVVLILVTKVGASEGLGPTLLHLCFPGAWHRAIEEKEKLNQVTKWINDYSVPGLVWGRDY